MSDYLWVEKYRPKTIEDCILSKDIKETFSQFLKQKEIPNWGHAGFIILDISHPAPPNGLQTKSSDEWSGSEVCELRTGAWKQIT